MTEPDDGDPTDWDDLDEDLDGDDDPPPRERWKTWALIAAAASGLVAIPISCAAVLGAIAADNIEPRATVEDAVSLTACRVGVDTVDVELALDNPWTRSIDVAIEIVVEADGELLARVVSDPMLVPSGAARSVTVTATADRVVPPQAACRILDVRELCDVSCEALTEADDATP